MSLSAVALLSCLSFNTLNSLSYSALIVCVASVEKEFLQDMFSNVNRYAEPELLKMVIEMRMEGYTDCEISRRARYELEDYKDWTLAEIKNLIRLLTRRKSSTSPLSRLVNDTKKYGNIEDYYKWDDLREQLEM